MTASKYNKLAGKHVLVIGGTSGIGFAVAEASIENGARVTVSSSREASIKTTLQRLSKPHLHAQISGHTCDFSKPSVEVYIEALFQKVGTVDHIVYTAGGKLAIKAFQSGAARGPRDGVVERYGTGQEGSAVQALEGEFSDRRGGAGGGCRGGVSVVDEG